MHTELNRILCIHTHTQFICVGTNIGCVRLLDHQGNQITSFTDGRKTFLPHRLSITQISVDSKGEFVASCSSDGTVSILLDAHVWM